MIRTAEISSSGEHRFLLIRKEFNPAPTKEGFVLWVMLNPSTADAETDDPTIRKCIGFTKEWGYDELRVVNLFGLRETDASKVRRAWEFACSDPHFDGRGDVMGPCNNMWIRGNAQNASKVVVAWGAHEWASGVADVVVGDELRPIRQEFHDGLIYCLGLTKGGYPRHPSRIAYTTELREYNS